MIWVIQTLGAMGARCPNLELFEYEVKDQTKQPPRNSDVDGHHIAFYVENMTAAIKHLYAHNVQIQGDVKTMEEGANAGLSRVYFLAPWGLQLELISAPDGMAYEQETDKRLWQPEKD